MRDNSREKSIMNNGANALIERNLAFLQIDKLNRIMSISRAINKAVVRLKDKYKLLESICRVYREAGGYKSAVIYSFSWFNNQLNNSILPEDMMPEDPANEINGIDLKLLGLNINHFKQGIAFISNDITQLKDEDVRAKLFDKGIRSLGIFPLLEDSEPSAALILFSEEYNIFDLREVEAVQETAEDISYALEVLKKDEELRRLSLAVVHGPTSILITDVNGNIEYVNPRFSEITGYASEEVIGKNPSMLKSGETKPEVYENLWNTIKAGKIWRGELLNKDKTGKLYWVSASISPLFNEKGEIINFISIREDITERVNMVDELLGAKMQAEKSDRLKAEFLAQMSHEVRTPINAILSFSELIKDELEKIVSDDLKESFYIIDRAGKRIIRTIDLMLNMSQITSGSYECHYREIDIYNEILSIIYYEFKLAAEAKGLSFNMVNKTDEALIYGDEYSVSQLLINIIENSVKFTEKGKIEVVISRKNGKILIDVSDTGIGISEEYKAALFQPFSQEEQGYTRSYEGVGLGLALSKKYCELNSASIDVMSQKGKGSTFRITFSAAA